MRKILLIAAALLVLAALPATGSAADMRKVLRITLNDIASLDPQQGTDLPFDARAVGDLRGALSIRLFRRAGDGSPMHRRSACPSSPMAARRGRSRFDTESCSPTTRRSRASHASSRRRTTSYSIKRSLDPDLRTGGDPALTDLIAGARPIVDAARKPGGKLDYDAPMDGLRALDRYTLQIKLNEVDYTLLERLAGLTVMAVAREVVEAAGNDIMSRPVGTGPYRLKEWKRASRVMLEANPAYRARRSRPAPYRGTSRSRRRCRARRCRRSAASRSASSRSRSRRSSRSTRATSTISASAATTRVAFSKDGKLKPETAKRGIVHLRFGAPSVTFTYFNMKDPSVGGYSNEQVALRRAIAMGFNIDEMIRVLFAGNALPANQLLPPGVNGHDTSLPARSLYDPAGARALLDRFGFKDRDGDGYRETPEGKPLTVVRGTLPESWYREVDTLWKKNMDAIGIRMEVQQQTFAELLNLSRAGKLPMFNLGYRSLEPSGYQILQTLWGTLAIDTNPSQFKQADYDAAYEQFLRTPAGPARTALARKMSELSQAYMPMLLHTYGVGNVVMYPWVQGYWPSQFGFSWKYLDIDLTKRKPSS